jgi:hypothetical protein
MVSKTPMHHIASFSTEPLFSSRKKRHRRFLFHLSLAKTRSKGAIPALYEVRDSPSCKKKASGKYPRSASSQPLRFQPQKESFSMMTKAEPIKLFVMLGTGTASHLFPRASGHLLQTDLQLLNSLRLSMPPFIVSDSTAITQHVRIPVFAATDAAVARFDGANAAFEIIVGARKVLHIVTAHQMRAHVQKGLRKRFESLVALLRRI